MNNKLGSHNLKGLIMLNAHSYEQTGRQIKHLLLGGYFFASHPRRTVICGLPQALYLLFAIITILMPSIKFSTSRSIGFFVF